MIFEPKSPTLFSVKQFFSSKFKIENSFNYGLGPIEASLDKRLEFLETMLNEITGEFSHDEKEQASLEAKQIEYNEEEIAKKDLEIC